MSYNPSTGLLDAEEIQFKVLNTDDLIVDNTILYKGTILDPALRSYVIEISNNLYQTEEELEDLSGSVVRTDLTDGTQTINTRFKIALNSSTSNYPYLIIDEPFQASETLFTKFSNTYYDTSMDILYRTPEDDYLIRTDKNLVLKDVLTITGGSVITSVDIISNGINVNDRFDTISGDIIDISQRILDLSATTLEEELFDLSARVLDLSTNYYIFESEVDASLNDFNSRITINENEITALDLSSVNYNSRITINENEITALDLSSVDYNSRITTNENEIIDLSGRVLDLSGNVVRTDTTDSQTIQSQLIMNFNSTILDYPMLYIREPLNASDTDFFRCENTYYDASLNLSYDSSESVFQFQSNKPVFFNQSLAYSDSQVSVYQPFRVEDGNNYLQIETSDFLNTSNIKYNNNGTIINFIKFNGNTSNKYIELEQPLRFYQQLIDLTNSFTGTGLTIDSSNGNASVFYKANIGVASSIDSKHVFQVYDNTSFLYKDGLTIDGSNSLITTPYDVISDNVSLGGLDLSSVDYNTRITTNENNITALDLSSVDYNSRITTNEETIETISGDLVNYLNKTTSTTQTITPKVVFNDYIELETINQENTRNLQIYTDDAPETKIQLTTDANGGTTRHSYIQSVYSDNTLRLYHNSSSNNQLILNNSSQVGVNKIPSLAELDVSGGIALTDNINYSSEVDVRKTTSGDTNKYYIQSYIGVDVSLATTWYYNNGNNLPDNGTIDSSNIEYRFRWIDTDSLGGAGSGYLASVQYDLKINGSSVASGTSGTYTTNNSLQTLAIGFTEQTITSSDSITIDLYVNTTGTALLGKFLWRFYDYVISGDKPKESQQILSNGSILRTQVDSELAVKILGSDDYRFTNDNLLIKQNTKSLDLNQSKFQFISPDSYETMTIDVIGSSYGNGENGGWGIKSNDTSVAGYLTSYKGDGKMVLYNPYGIDILGNGDVDISGGGNANIRANVGQLGLFSSTDMSLNVGGSSNVYYNFGGSNRYVFTPNYMVIGNGAVQIYFNTTTPQITGKLTSGLIRDAILPLSTNVNYFRAGQHYFQIYDGSGNLLSNNFQISSSGGAVDVYVNGSLVHSSDRRIKKDIRELDDEECLTLVRRLKPCKYRYIAKETTKDIIGFIAQEVKEVIPDAVRLKEREIPNIMKKAEIDGEILIFKEDVELKEGDRIKTGLITNDDIIVKKKISNRIYECSNLIHYDEKEINDERVKILITECFVYGVVVNDFHELDKNAIFTTGIGAIQELDRKISNVVDNSNEIKRLKEENSNMKLEISSLQSKIKILTDAMVKSGML